MEINKKSKDTSKSEIENSTTQAQVVEDTTSPEEKLKLLLKTIKKSVEERYGSCAIFALPNKKRVIVRGPTEQEYDMWSVETERAALARQRLQPGKSIQDIWKQMVKTCIVSSPEYLEIIATYDDVVKYPACIPTLANKIENLAGCTVSEDFLD